MPRPGRRGLTLSGSATAPAPPPLGEALPELQAPRSPLEIFQVFTRIALQGFGGGVMPVAQHLLVERERWVTRVQFLEFLSVGQVLPGANMLNLSLMVGDRFFGLRGALAALGGMLCLPTVLVLLMAAAYTELASVPRVVGAVRGMGAVSAGLVLATTIKLLPSVKHNPMGHVACALVALVTLATVGVLRLPLLWVTAILGSASIAWAWARIGR